MASLNGVNTNAEPAKDFEVLPVGDYKAVIESEESKRSRAGDEYLVFKFKIIEGPAKNRVLFHNLNLWHQTSPKAKEIAEGHLSAIREASGIAKEALRDTHQLFNRPMTIRLGIEHDAQYGDKNKITSWKPVGNSHSAGGTSRQTTPPTSGTGSAQSGTYVPPMGPDGNPAYEDDHPGF